MPANNPPAINNQPATNNTNSNSNAQQSVQQPAVRSCAQMSAARNTITQAEAATFANCGLLIQGCQALAAAAVATLAEKSFYASNCNQPVQQQSQQVGCEAGNQSGSLSYSGGPSAKALVPGCGYQICLSSTVSAKAPGDSSAHPRTVKDLHMVASPGGAFGVGSSPCVYGTVATSGIKVSFTCDQSFSTWTSWSGGFSYTITAQSH